MIHSLNASLQERCLEWDRALNSYYRENSDKKLCYPFRVFFTLHCIQREAYFALSEYGDPNDYSFDTLNLKICQTFLPDFTFPVEESGLTIAESLQEIFTTKAHWFKTHKMENPKCLVRVKGWENFYVPPPPSKGNSSFWEGQYSRLLSIKKNLSKKQETLALDWRFLAGPKGKNFVNILIDYLSCHQVDPSVFFKVRASLMEGALDGFHVCEYFQDLYQAPRPFVEHPDFIPLFGTETSHSYPSAHSTVAGVAFTILHHYFPQERQIWNQISHELMSSRLWAGVHYPIDAQEGYNLGREIGRIFILEEHLNKSPFSL